MVAEAQHEPPGPVRVGRLDDERLLAAFYARWAPLVYSLALRSLPAVEDAEEATQRTFTRAWTSGCALELDDGPVPPWLVTIAGDQIEDVSAGRRRSRSAGGSTASDERADQLAALDGLARLDPGPRQALQLALHDQLDHQEIAARTGESVAAIRSQLRRGLEALRRGLEVEPRAHRP